MINEDDFSEFFECSFSLSRWVQGTDLMVNIMDQFESQVAIFRQLYQWKKSYLLLPKPTLSTPITFVFWAHKSIIDTVLRLPVVQGGFQVGKTLPKPNTYSPYKGKKQSPRSRRVLIDIGCDFPDLVSQLKQFGLEVEYLWDYVADLIHYEIINICTSQYFDLLLTTNERLFTPPEEWLTYLMPRRTQILFIQKNRLKDPENFAQEIYQQVHTKRKFKSHNPHQTQLISDLNSIKNKGDF